jgi:uncharacterized protein YrrD
MATASARSFLGQSVVAHASPNSSEHLLGIVESVTIDPQLMRISGFLVGQAGKNGSSRFLPLECVEDFSPEHLSAHKSLLKRPPQARRILGLQAWTTQPKFFVGFVHDVIFLPENGMIESFAINQLIRTWSIPSAMVAKITPKSLLIENHTTSKLKVLPYPN